MRDFIKMWDAKWHHLFLQLIFFKKKDIKLLLLPMKKGLISIRYYRNSLYRSSNMIFFIATKSIMEDIPAGKMSQSTV